MTICGNCKERGQTVEHVRACYAGQTVQAAVKGVVNKHLNGAPAITVEPAHPVTEPGVYFDGERYYKVVQNQEGTRLYAKVWEGEWVYAPGALRDLYAEQKVTAEQAARFGKLWGSCVFCSRLLTDERSVAVGYGPVCADHNGLPWGERVTA